MTLEKFASTYRLKIPTNECGEQIIPGKYGQIYFHSDGLLAVMYMPDPRNERPEKLMHRVWKRRKLEMKAIGSTISVDCESEGVALFDPKRQDQTKLAIRVAGIKRKRILSEKQLAVIERIQAANPIGRRQEN